MSDHHEQGPSSLKNLFKCRRFVKSPKWNEMQAEGSLGHKLWETGERLPGYDSLNALVDKLDDSWMSTVQTFRMTHGIGEESREVRLDYPGLNFGTMDRLIVADNVALIGDAKFGNWSVEDATTNDQGHNYGLYVFHHYPEVQTLWIWFGNPRREEYTLAKFSRRVFAVWLAAISRVVKEAQDENFHEYTYDPVNCSFCSRLNCPVRIKLAAGLVEAATGRVFDPGTLSPSRIDLSSLTTLKSLTNSLKTFVDQVDKEAKSRVLEDGDEMQGYEIKEKVRRRVIYGWDNIDATLTVFRNIVGTHPGLLMEDAELSFSSLEKAVVDFYGSKTAAQPTINTIREELEAQGLLTTESYHYLAATNT